MVNIIFCGKHSQNSMRLHFFHISRFSVSSSHLLLLTSTHTQIDHVFIKGCSHSQINGCSIVSMSHVNDYRDVPDLIWTQAYAGTTWLIIVTTAAVVQSSYIHTVSFLSVPYNTNYMIIGLSGAHVA